VKRAAGAPAALVSIHDVTPRHLPRVLKLMEVVADAGAPPPTLLVVPASGWTPDTLATLRSLVERGHRLAGHGWDHRSGPRRGLYHRIHGLLLSRDQGEHLSRTRAELLERVRRCFQWFPANGLPSPELYVPPAWALGSLARKDLPTLPFRWYEVLDGLLDARTGRMRRLPLAGFEADTRTRQISLKVLNRANLAAARGTGRPLRISLHPRDLDLHLGRDVKAMLRLPWRFVDELEALG
jgi:uncharacterized protein